MTQPIHQTKKRVADGKGKMSAQGEPPVKLLVAMTGKRTQPSPAKTILGRVVSRTLPDTVGNELRRLIGQPASRCRGDGRDMSRSVTLFIPDHGPLES